MIVISYRLSKIEAEISSLEKKIATDDERLSVAYEVLMNDAAFFDDYSKKKNKVEKLMEEWELLQEELDSIK